jgi:hypothetical protein
MSRRLCFSLSVFALFVLTQTTSAARVVSSQAPLFFEPNQGQAPPEVRFLLRDGITHAFFRTNGLDLFPPQSGHRTSPISVSFVGSNDATIVNGTDLLPGRTNYLVGDDPSRWLHNVANFGRVRYQNLYPGIDAVFYGNNRSLEHDFEIAPHANPSRIALQLRGASGMDLSPAGDLVIHVKDGNLIFKKPGAYQEINGTHRPVEASFALAKNRSIRFRLGKYDNSRKLVIDPVLVYATYLGQNEAIPAAVATDAAGNTYITGTVYVLPFPTTPGALQTACSGCTWQVAFVTKLNASGAAQVYSTLLGGNGFTGTNSIAVDSVGNAIVGGQTEATNFPTKNPFLPLPPNYGGFIVSLSPDGAALNFGALLPGGGITATNDAQGNVYLTGSTLSGTYPTTSAALNQPGSDGFTYLTKLSTSGSIVASAVIGPRTDITSKSSSITVDGAGNIFITGTTESTWPTTTGAYQTQPPVSANDIGFIAKLAPDCSKFIYSTFVGPGKPVSIALDSNEDAWIADSADITYPVTANAFNSTYGPAAFSELSPDGSKLLYSSTIAGNDPPFHNSITGIAVDRNNNVWVTGSDPDAGFPVLDPLVSFGDGGYITEFDPTGTKIEFSTLYGGIALRDQQASIAGIALDSSGKTHVAGATQGGIYITPGAFLDTTQYGPDGSDFSFSAVIDPSAPAPAICPNLSALGSPSAYEGGVLQLTNCGTANLNFQSFTTSESAYAISSNSCTGSLSVNASCSLIVQFTPTPGQDCNATLTITSNASLPTVIPLTLGPLTDCPFTSAAAAVSPTSLIFGSQAIATISSPQTVTLTNPGYGPLLITSITTSQEFPQTSTCGQSLAPGASCTVSISFSPLADGLRPAMLTIVDSAGFSPQTVALSGTGTGPAPSVTLSPTLLDFSVPAFNQSSAPQTVTLTNSGQGPLSIASIATSPNGGFTQSNTCPSLLSAGANCTIAVTFSTTTGLNGNDSLTITDNAVDSPQTVTLWGNVSWVSLTSSPAALTIASKGATAQSTIQVTSLGGFTGPVPLSCFITWEGAGTPSLYPGCTVFPSPANVTAAGASATLNVSTLGGTSSASLPGQPQTLRRSATLLAALLGLILVPRRRWLGCALLILIFVLLAGGISACGGGSGSTGGSTGGSGGGSLSGATPGNYLITIQAGSGSAGSIVSTTTVAVTVQ